MKRICILGSTGSIGCQTLQVLTACQQYKIELLTARKNWKLLVEQANIFKPKYIALDDATFATQAREALKNIASKTKLLTKQSDIQEVCTQSKVTHVLAAVVGIGAIPTIASAIRASKIILLANKEAIVVSGTILMRLAKRHKATIFPLDSEPSAILRCLGIEHWLKTGSPPQEVKNLLLTASGGPFYGKSKKQLENVTVAQALKHPTWRMGKKISVDSATLVNKGYELIECSRLFNISEERIKVIVHRQSIVHSMVEFVDGSVIAELAAPDMRLPISSALYYPQKPFAAKKSALELFKSLHIDFEALNESHYPAVKLARQTLQEGDWASIVYSAANDCACDLFIQGKIPFINILNYVKTMLNKTQPQTISTVIAGCNLYTDTWKRCKNLLCP